jgi:hypothetical protein
MVTYWKFQTVIDVAVAALCSILVWVLPQKGFPAFFVIDHAALTTAGRAWVAPSLTLLGMMSATTAFVFSVVDRQEFSILRSSTAEAQLWRTFSENLFWLAVAAIFAACITFLKPAADVSMFYIATFLIIIVSISIMKFIWVMRQIISVRIAQSERKSSGAPGSL